MYKVLFITFGCKVNQYETECLKELFRQRGWAISTGDEQPEAIVINSCTVTASGDSRVLTALRRSRADYPGSVIVLTGCYPQADPEGAVKLQAADIVCGTRDRKLIPDMVEEFLSQRQRKIWLPEHERGELFEPLKCTRYEDNTRAFVKIQDGCDRFCTYCIIPYARGRCRSKPLEMLREEAEEIAVNGVKEIVLSGINLAFYGAEWGLSLADAAETVAGITGIERVRLSSLEPEQLTDSQLERLSALPELCPQFHLSLQSGCTRTLKAMNRHYTADEYFELTERIRRYFPDCTFTTDIMVGFPQETDEDFLESAEFVKKVGFSEVHVFRYSRRPGTPADKMSGQVSEAVKSRRYKLMTAAAAQAREEYLKTLIGRTVPVLFERERSPEFHQGRAPDHTLIKISRKNPEKSLRNRIISVIIEVAGLDECIGRIANDNILD